MADTDLDHNPRRPRRERVSIARGMRAFQLRRRIALAVLDKLEKDEVVTISDLHKLREGVE